MRKSIHQSVNLSNLLNNEEHGELIDALSKSNRYHMQEILLRTYKMPSGETGWEILVFSAEHGPGTGVRFLVPENPGTAPTGYRWELCPDTDTTIKTRDLDKGTLQTQQQSVH